MVVDGVPLPAVPEGDAGASGGDSEDEEDENIYVDGRRIKSAFHEVAGALVSASTPFTGREVSADDLLETQGQEPSSNDTERSRNNTFESPAPQRHRARGSRELEDPAAYSWGRNSSGSKRTPAAERQREWRMDPRAFSD